MPKVKVDLPNGKTKEQKRILLDIIHQALVDEIGIPKEDRMQIVYEHAPENFSMPYTKAEDYINIDITMYPGRTVEAKKNLIRALITEFGKIGMAKDQVMITLHEPDIENWSS